MHHLRTTTRPQSVQRTCIRRQPTPCLIAVSSPLVLTLMVLPTSTPAQTHLMDEAAFLCDRLAIVTHGAMRVIGSQQELKARFPGHLLIITFPPLPASVRPLRARTGPGKQPKALLLVRVAVVGHCCILCLM